MDPSVKFDLIVVGGGAAGVFAALSAKVFSQKASILILEQSKTLLAKVRSSGGGRCNVTNACFDPKKLVQNYPRGSRELLGPFHVFQPKDMMEWLEGHGVALKIEAEGRVFPTSNSSETIIRTFITELERLNIPVLFEKGVENITKEDSYFKISCKDSSSFIAKKILLATGGSKHAFSLAKSLGHTIIEPVPSLFSFLLQNFALSPISGVTVEHVEFSIPGTKLFSSGSLLITHTGFSGPATLRLSSLGARHLASKEYHETLLVDWLPALSPQEIIEALLACKQTKPASTLANENPFPLPKSLWKLLLGIYGQKKCKDLSHKDIQSIANTLKKSSYLISGKAQHKDEFVTCGGVSLKEVNFRTFESKICPHLFLAGEILDIDGITGGFNLQNAWTTGFIAGTA